ncbi:heavy metal-binding domain-containing protein [Marinospirillum minutulum]|uniref:heavy metal-binding domain-containing protein n=1 Tax=Marinospirillum minutulum TaxID=64974 RepID=UPI00047FB72F|nr:heavy metal-binding domain-containing protein [Marinospirillum minutulum]
MGLFSSKENKSSVTIPRELLNEKIQVSVCDTIPNKTIVKLVSAVFSEKTYMPTMRKSEEHFTFVREEVQYMLMQQALELGANAIVGFKLSFAPFNAQGTNWGVSMVVASANAVITE